MRLQNTDGGTDALETVQAYYEAILNGRERPKIDWEFDKDGSIRVKGIGTADRSQVVAGIESQSPRFPRGYDRASVEGLTGRVGEEG